jgi:hypothetical protein
MIIVNERPYDLCMSGNPIGYELYSALAATDADIYFEVRIKFCYTHTLSFATLVTFPVYPVAGIAKFDIKDFLDGKLAYDLPEFNAEEKDATLAPNHAGKFYIEFREILTAGSDPSWNDSESDYEKFVMKGGLTYFTYRGDNFWENYFNDNNPFLTWRESGRFARMQDRMYLAFLNVDTLPSFLIGEEVIPAALWASAKVYYTDGTESARQYHEVPPDQAYAYSINFIPAGCHQWSLQDLNPAKQIHKWDIQMYYTSAADGTKTELNDPFIFEADNRNDYNNFLLQFRNSLGGIDPILLRGDIDPNLNYNYTEQQRTFLTDYFSGDYITPARIIANSTEKVIWKADAGWLSKEEQDRLRDMNLERNAWWNVGNNDKWWPVNIITPSFKQKSSGDERWQFPVEFSLAHDGDKYYTPGAIDLGDRVFASNVCTAELSAIITTVDTSGPTATMEFSFTYPGGLTEFRYQIPGVHAEPIDAEVTDLPITITDLALEQSFVLKLWPVCSNGVRGRLYSAAFNTIGDGGSGSGGTGGSGNSTVENQSGEGENVLITIDAVEVFDNYLPSGDTGLFNQADGTVDVVMTLEHTATGATLTTDGVEYDDPVISGNNVTWIGVIMVDGCAITYF